MLATKSKPTRFLSPSERRRMRGVMRTAAISISDLARRLLLHRSRISAVLNGTEPASPHLLRRIARAAGIPPSLDGTVTRTSGLPARKLHGEPE